MNTRAIFAVPLLLALLGPPGAAQPVDLLALGQGTLPVVEPATYQNWPPINLLDDDPATGWAGLQGQTANAVFVFELGSPATLTTLEFDTARIDGDGRGAKDVTVEVSTDAGGGFRRVLAATLADRADGQRFPAAARAEARFVRLTLLDNHGDGQWLELMGFHAYGEKTTGAALPIDISGTYHTNWNDFHLRQQGAAVTGCYEYHEGRFDGTAEGRVMKLTWVQSNGRGPAVFVFAPDGRSFRGYWWYETDKGKRPDGDWTGERRADKVGSCPHWSGSLSGELEKEMKGSGRARLYGILFDTDSARIRSESFATLDEVVKLLTAQPSWKITIEGHTDSTGTPPHNQTLSEERARSVRDYLTSKGVGATRLQTAGFGQTKPVADNASELGRAQNRRVELVRD